MGWDGKAWIRVYKRWATPKKKRLRGQGEHDGRNNSTSHTENWGGSKKGGNNMYQYWGKITHI